MCHFYSFRQSAPKPSVGVFISHLCHYATCILHRLGNFIERILVCCFEAGKLHSNFGNERKLKHRETFTVTWKKSQAKPERLTLQNWFRSQCLVTGIIHQQNLTKACTVPSHSKHSTALRHLIPKGLSCYICQRIKLTAGAWVLFLPASFPCSPCPKPNQSSPGHFNNAGWLWDASFY